MLPNPCLTNEAMLRVNQSLERQSLLCIYLAHRELDSTKSKSVLGKLLVMLQVAYITFLRGESVPAGHCCTKASEWTAADCVTASLRMSIVLLNTACYQRT